MKTLTIANKRRVKTTDKGITYSTAGYGGGEVFTIILSSVVSQKPSTIPINDVAFEEAIEYVIKDWGFKIVEDKIKGMSKYHLIMPETNN